MAKTVEQIATDLNLSITTVRLVLNGNAQRYRISAKTQKKINDYVDKYGYTINHIARSLKLNKTDTLGLVVPNLSNPFFSLLAESLELCCRDKGYQLMICCTYNDLPYELKLVKSLEERNVDGIFVITSHSDAQKQHIKDVNKPLIFLDRDYDFPKTSWVVSDNFGGGYLLTKSMLDTIHHPILFLAGAPTLPPVRERINGHVQAMLDYGFSEPEINVYYAKNDHVTDGEKILHDYIEQYNDIPQNFIASSLPILEGVISLLRQHFGYIPDQINIGAFDEHLMLNFLANNIWSIKQNEKMLAEQSLFLMQQKIEDNNSQEQHIIVPIELICRLKNKI